MRQDRYPATLSRLYARTNGGIKLGLETMEALLGALGHPERAVPHIVVAGTNGKGSTSTLIAGGLSAAGYRVGHFTSPHLLRFTERVRLGDREIEPTHVVALAERVFAAEVGCPRPPTFFELVTAMALVAFAEAHLEVAVLEVGMGGRLDATNAVAKALSVITAVDLDHQHYLGATRAEIAVEKAGIIATHGTAVIAAQQPDALAVIERIGRERGAELVHARATALRDGKLWLEERRPRPTIAFAKWPPGAYQRDNLACAMTALDLLAERGWRLTPAALEQAARDFCWPGRYQWLAGSPDVLVDGAHNPAGIAALMAALDEDSRLLGRPLHTVATVLGDRPPEAMLPALAARSTSLHLTPVRSPRSRTPAELGQLSPGAKAYAGAREAIGAATANARADGGLVLVCGSLMLVADALEILTGERRDPPVDG
jgi:dihydrofolate synthase / folylpolyglutamate synthase